MVHQAPGIWHSRYVLPHASQGDFDILGLTIDDDEVIKSAMTLSLIPPAAMAAKAMSRPGADGLPDPILRDAESLYRSYLGEH